MKKVSAILIFAVFLIAANAGYSQSIAYPYQVGNWPDFRTAAVSYTFDDGCSNQFAIAIPMFNEFGYKLTLFTITGSSPAPNWTGLQNAANQGHEAASHTVTHSNLSGLTVAQQTAELANSQSAINSHVTGSQCVTLAYPYCAPSNPLSLTATYYIGARHCQGFIEGNTPGDYYQISSVICGNLGTVNTAADFNSKFASVASTKGWCVFLIHGIDGDGGYSPLSSTVLRSSLQYLDARRSTYWVSTFGNVIRYAKERNDVNVHETSNTGDSITLQVTDTLNNTLYNYPLTIRRPLPAGWSSAKVTQNGLAIDSNVVDVNSVKYVMFNAVPDGGNIVINNFVLTPLPPVAQDANASTLTNTPVSITLAATDDGLPNPPSVLSYIIASLPGHGTLSDPCAGSINSVPYTLASNGKQVAYTPATNYGGADNFTFKTNDSGVPPQGGDSNVATVSINIRFTITASAGPNGSIYPNGALIRNLGDSVLFTATSNALYRVDKWYVDSNVVQTGGNTYTLTNIMANHTVQVTFAALPQYTVTATAGQHGHIEPAGAVLVYQDFNQMFTATANNGYVVGTWFVDGNVVQGGGSTYTMHNVQANHDLLVTFSQPSAALYVNAGSPNDPGTGKQNDPFRRLQDAINAVQDINTEVWVVAGTYKPTTGNDRTISFVMKQGVGIYGGFTGTETQRDQRDWVAHPTILSGDIGTADDNSDNSFTVVVGDINSVLDGFTITGGNANDTDSWVYLYGGGIYNQAGYMTIANCNITANSAIAGGGIFNVGDNSRITNCTFSENNAGEGGGMRNSDASPAVVNCSFIRNYADNGGGIYNSGGNPAIVSCVLSQNSAISGGGTYDYLGNPAFVNCLLTQNSADYGGGMFEFYNNLTISNCTFNGNISSNGEALACDSEEQSYPSAVTIVNCIIWNGTDWLWNNDGSTTNVYYSDVEAGWSGTGNKNTNPLFMGANDFRLQINSPCVDVGNNNSVPADIADLDDDGNKAEPIPFDIAGNPRIADGNHNGVAVVDMGAYERCGLIADFTDDCKVSFADFAIMAKEWLTSGTRADIYPKNSPDGIVDILDLAVLAEEWLK